MKVPSKAVIGLNYGDEGKGLMTDYFCHEYAKEYGVDNGLCIRFNGGAQAGHTVVTPTGQRHVFHHFSSGSFVGVATLLSKFFLVNPILFRDEYLNLLNRAIVPTVYVDPRALVTTPWDMMLNQARERSRGVGSHGSCGVGIGATMERNKDLPLLVPCLSNGFYRNAVEARDYSFQKLREEGLADSEAFVRMFLSDKIFEDFLGATEFFLQHTYLDLPYDLKYRDFLVFEGAQGLRLDMDNTREFPHVTYSKTDETNIRALCEEAYICEPEYVYVTRAFNTRHGNGKFEKWSECEVWVNVKEECKTNLPHEFQGVLKYGPLDLDWIKTKSKNGVVSVTHMDNVQKDLDVIINGQRQVIDSANLGNILDAEYLSFGPTRNDIKSL